MNSIANPLSVSIDQVEREQSLLDSLVAEIKAIDFLRDDDVTVTRLIEATGANRNTVERLIKDKVARGELVAVPSHYPTTGKAVKAFRRPG
jgi:hypothetical protein